MTIQTAIAIAPEDPRQPDVRELIAALDRMMVDLYPAESNHLLDIETLAGSDITFLVARQGKSPVGCGAVRRHAGGLCEIKRMFVAPEARGLGLGRKILERLESEARRQHLTHLALETGIHQPEAIALYRRAGFRECAPFAGYRPDPLSLFMSKELV
jgi:putative acetyltransferase